MEPRIQSSGRCEPDPEGGLDGPMAANLRGSSRTAVRSAATLSLRGFILRKAHGLWVAVGSHDEHDHQDGRAVAFAAGR